MEESEKTPLPCAEKLTFNTKDEADASAAAVRYQRGTKLRAYECRYCRLWHLTSDYSDN